ncbi:MAG: L-threonine synthase [candidate division WS6 bacterium GW2011_GWA2_37_6]|uniref:L-threonine synthase n=1 Tax=candidate division WS6 bacterium GW2011_GWA2_37_6 TaxID=1619087 RepID=A0A0G0H2E6_9BACT|nr:MAG: L-threonine synthase [candidate division WS6 bacterium GW2011_GWA2_37_6]
MSIWKHDQINSLIDEKYQLTINEGGTSLIKIFLDRQEQKELGIKDGKTQKLYLKLETMNPNKSFKDRSLAYQISYYYSKGKKKLLISSSGNAAVSAAAYVSLTDMKLAVFVSNKVNKAKLERLNKFVSQNPNISLNFSMRPKSDAIKYSLNEDYVNLRGSMDENAVVGFKTISHELFEELTECDAIFVPCSSGTSTVGISQGYDDLKLKAPALHICQTSKVHPIAKNFDIIYTPTKTSLSDAIVDRVAKREQQVLDIIQNTNGSGWILSDEDIERALKFLKRKTKLPDLTYNGILSFAGLVKALKRHKQFTNPVCIISGI